MLIIIIIIPVICSFGSASTAILQDKSQDMFSSMWSNANSSNHTDVSQRTGGSLKHHSIFTHKPVFALSVRLMETRTVERFPLHHLSCVKLFPVAKRTRRTLTIGWSSSHLSHICSHSTGLNNWKCLCMKTRPRWHINVQIISRSYFQNVCIP